MTFSLVVWIQTLVSPCDLLGPTTSAVARYTGSVIQAAMILAGGFGTPCAGRDVAHCMSGSGHGHVGRPVMPDLILLGHAVCNRHWPSSSSLHRMCLASACCGISQHNWHHTILCDHHTLYYPSTDWYQSPLGGSKQPGSPGDRTPDRTALVVYVRPTHTHPGGHHSYTSSLCQQAGDPMSSPMRDFLLDCQLWASTRQAHRGTDFRSPPLTWLPRSSSHRCSPSVWRRSGGRRLLPQYPANTHVTMDTNTHRQQYNTRIIFGLSPDYR